MIAGGRGERQSKGQRIQRKNKMVEIKASVEETMPPIKIVFPTEKVVNEALKMGLPVSLYSLLLTVTLWLTPKYYVSLLNIPFYSSIL